MLAPRASSAFVCIRCELKLAWPRRPALPRRAPHATFSTTARRAATDADDDAAHAQAEIEKPHPQPTAYPLGRLIKRRGKAAIRETTARLGELKTLGHDAQILVLREVGEAPEADNTTSETIPAGPDEAINIIESLQQEKRPFSQQEVLEQFDSLRPTTQADPNEPHYVSQSTFIKLSKTLLRLFNGQQLSHYYSVRKGVKRKNVGKQVIEGLKELQSKANSKKPAIRSDWHPGTTQISLRLPGLAVHRKPKQKAVSKHLVVDQILRDVWKLVLLEEIEAPGEIELSLRPWQVALLFPGPKSTPLDQIGQSRKAKIEVYKYDNVVRITADKVTAEYAADDMEKLLEGIESKRLDLTPWTTYLKDDAAAANLADVFSDRAVRDVAAMTGASIQLVSKSTLVIRALDQASVEEAQRCVIGMLPLNKDASTITDMTRRDAVRDQTYLLPMPIEQTSLDYQIRNRTLGRWSLPIMRTAAVSESGEPAASSKDTFFDTATRNKQIDDVQTELRKSVETSMSPAVKGKSTSGEWDVEPEIALSADFGLVLYDMANSKTRPDSDTGATAFLPSVPGFPKILIDRTFVLKSRPHPPALEYTFVAAPKQPKFKEDQRFPRLKVQFRYNERTGDYFLAKVGLRFDERTHDVLLPDKVVDIRFHKQTNLRLIKPEANEDVAAFIGAVKTNIQSGEKLTAPSLQLAIPEWTLSDDPERDQLSTKPVKYLFTGVQFRQGVAAKYLGAEVSFNTVQSGKLGRKGSSLSAYHNSPVMGQKQNQADLTNQAQLEKFVKRCFAIAGKITQAAGSEKAAVDMIRPRDEVAKPRDQNSARKIRRQELQAVAGNELGEVGAERVVAASNAVPQLGTPEAESVVGADDKFSVTAFDGQIQAADALSPRADTEDILDTQVGDHEVGHGASSTQLGDEDLDDPYLASILQDPSPEPNSSLSTFAPSEKYDDDLDRALKGPQKVAA